MSFIFLIGSATLRNHDINCPYERYIGLALCFIFLNMAMGLLGFVDSNTDKKSLDIELLIRDDDFPKSNISDDSYIKLNKR